MYSVNDKLYIQTSDMPTLNEKINRAIELASELDSVLKDLKNYNLQFEIESKKEEI